jgi:hypothetical protein
MFHDLSLGFEGVEDQTRREVVAMALGLHRSCIKSHANRNHG